jgi:hypothetical protein
MPKDTPKDVKPLKSMNAQVFWSDIDGHRVWDGDFKEAKGAKMLILNFYPTSKIEGDLVLFASSKTGNPGPQNFEQKAVGHNVSLAFLRPSTDVLPVYFNNSRTRDAVKTVEYIVQTVSSPLSSTVTLKGKEMELELNETSTEVDSYLFFTLPNVPANSEVNITAKGMLKNGMIITFELYASKDRLVQYPNKNNFDWSRTASKLKSDTEQFVSLQVPVKESGALHFGTLFCIQSGDKPRIKISIDIKQK